MDSAPKEHAYQETTFYPTQAPKLMPLPPKIHLKKRAYLEMSGGPNDQTEAASLDHKFATFSEPEPRHQPSPPMSFQHLVADPTNELSSVARSVSQESLHQMQPVQNHVAPVYYETKDGFPLHKEDLLLCAALINLGQPRPTKLLA